MANYGPSDLQERVQREFKDFFNAVMASPERADEFQPILLNGLEAILNKAFLIGTSLSLNETYTIDDVAHPVQEILQRLNLNIAKAGLLQLSKKYNAAYTDDNPVIVKKRLDPTHLKQIGETLTDIETGEQYVLTLKLAGRGQAGLANFYQGPDGQERLIKEDDVGTCLMEGTAYYIQETGLLPGNLGSSVNFAKVGTLSLADSAKPSIISIQDRVKPTQPDGKVRAWDELVYGVKRNPKTLMSFEAWYPNAIKESVLLLNTSPKWQLAAGIMASAIAGDESLHVGQFMASLDAHGEVDGIKRIDLGARERFAVARRDAKQDPYNTSSCYVKSGQFGKNYVSYLLAEPSLHNMYTMLWMNLSAEHGIEKIIMMASKQAFLKQFAAIPEPLQHEALTKVLETINKSTKKPLILDPSLPLTGQAEMLASTLADLDAQRVVNMIAISEMVYAEKKRDLTQKVTKLLPSEHRELFNGCMRLQEKLIVSRQFSLENLHLVLANIEKVNYLVKELVEQSSQAPSPEIFEKIQLLTELGSDLILAATLNLQYVPEMSNELNIPINNHLNRLQTLNELATYCLETSSKEKKNYASMMMVKALGEPSEFLSYIKNPGLIDNLKTHQSIMSGSVSSAVVKVHTRGELLLTRLFKRYHQDDKLLMMTQIQHELIADIKAGRFEKVLHDVNNVAFTDMITPDQEGKTALHYLMALGGEDEHSKKAICVILSKSIGAATNTNLNIPDAEGKTPLDLLMANPKAKEIVQSITDQNIRGYYYGGGQYLIHHFFNLEIHDPTYKERLNVDAPKASSSSRWW